MYIADLHIHSNYSRATSRDCVPEFLDLWARKKGIQLIGSGDFTHPAWRQELKEKLVPAEEGLYALRPELQMKEAPDSVTARFVITGEISSIYKKNGKTRKVHNLILLPNLEAAEVLAQRLEAIGNIHSDGRPILGLDSRDLLEITLEACPDAVFIPAHIWTPHFSLFGAFSGFDTIEECFEDLTPHIHALETGLSSDPPMNWQVSALDPFTLVSNSDAHSPSKLGREANLLDTGLSYPQLAEAIQGGAEKGFAGTLEFFPEEGKYHFDGHRNCGLCLTPSETEIYGGRCPVCGKKLTIGVQHRVEELADRPEGYRPPGALPFESLVPLPEVIAASTGLSSGSKKTAELYEDMLSDLGPEFYILRECPLEDVRHAAGPCVEEGIRRLRAGQVQRTPGFDGEYGKIELLDPSEIEKLNGQISLFAVRPPAKKGTARTRLKQSAPEPIPESGHSADTPHAFSPLDGLNPEQMQAVVSSAPAVAVIAGPGTGKTKTLVAKISHLLNSGKAKPSEITAVTFTNKAAGELRERLEQQCGGKRAVRSMTIGTFHSICLDLLAKQQNSLRLADPAESLELAGEVLAQTGLSCSAGRFLQEVSKFKNGLAADHSLCSTEAYSLYCSRLSQAGLLDFDDLLLQTLTLLEDNVITNLKRFTYLLVDEFQDINDVQYRLLRAWSQQGKEVFAIGDPDQSIYGFRGSDAHCFERLFRDFPSLKTIDLVNNYRSTPEILSASLSVISQNPGAERILHPQLAHGDPVRLLTAPNDFSEAVFVAKEINRLSGGIDMLDAQRMSGEGTRSFSDIAVLYRTNRQAELLEKCLRKESIPYVIAGRDDFLNAPAVRGTLGFFRFLLDWQDAYSLHSCLSLIWNCPEDLIGFAQQLYASCPPGNFEALESLSPELEGRGPLPLFHQVLLSLIPLYEKESPRKLLERFAEKQGLAEKEELVKLLHTAVFHRSLPEFLQTLLLGQDYDIRRSGGKQYDSGAVTLMTLHASKGLEFPVIFLCGVKKGCLPLETLRRTSDIEEERRLFYVGMTRAKEELILLTSPEPSIFLDSIPKGMLKTGDVMNRTRPREAKQLSLFD